MWASLICRQYGAIIKCLSLSFISCIPKTKPHRELFVLLFWMKYFDIIVAFICEWVCFVTLFLVSYTDYNFLRCFYLSLYER